MGINYDAITFISKYILLTLSKYESCLLKQPLKTQTKLKEQEIMY